MSIPFLLKYGNYPVEYNRAIHGPYDPSRYYGKPDTPFGEVKLSDLKSWFARRNKSPKAMMGVMGRAVHRTIWRFYAPRYSGVIFYSQIAALLVVWSYLINWKTIRHEKNWKHHW